MQKVSLISPCGTSWSEITVHRDNRGHIGDGDLLWFEVRLHPSKFSANGGRRTSCGAESSGSANSLISLICRAMPKPLETIWSSRQDLFANLG